MVRFIARIIGIGIETADMLVSEILSRGLRDSKAVAAMPASRLGAFLGHGVNVGGLRS